MVPEGTGPVAEEVTESGLLRFLDGLDAGRGGISNLQPKCTLTMGKLLAQGTKEAR